MKKYSLILCYILVFVVTISGSTAVSAYTGSNVTIVAETTDGSITPPPEDEPDPPIIIIQNYPATMEVGETTKLSYALRNSDTDDISWKSSNSDVISVNSDGQVTANAAGTAKITVTAGSATDTVNIRVNEIKAESIKIVSDDLSLTGSVTGYNIDKGDIINLKVEAEPENSAVGDIQWEVSDPDVAEIDSDGRLVALANGKVTVTASTDDNLRDSIEIQVGSTIPWVLIGIAAAVALLIIILIILIIRKKMRGGSNTKRSKKNKSYIDEDDDDEDDDENIDDDNTKTQDDFEKEKERIRQEAYRQGLRDRDKEMTKVFDPKDFDFDDKD